MAVFDYEFIKRMNQFKRMAAKAQVAERKFIEAFEALDYGEIEQLIELIEKKGHPIHQAKVKEFREKLRKGEVSGSDIVSFQDVVEANRIHLEEGENS